VRRHGRGKACTAPRNKEETMKEKGKEEHERKTEASKVRNNK
jgi:hypothetical protein